MKLRKSIYLRILLVLLCTGTMILIILTEKKAVQIQSDLADHVLRFHVLANSDSEEDQALKRKVRDALLQEINEELPDDADLSDTKAYLSSHEASLQETACRIVRQNGFDYPVEFRLEPWYFPTKTYGDMTFPSGTYDAFRVIIGKGEGKNWWCVLYPSLCFIDSTYSIVPDSSKAALRDTLQADTYESLLHQKPQAGFRLGEWLKRLF